MSKPAYEKFLRGEPLTRKQAMGAQCYCCNGFSVQMADDCLGKSCPLYQWSPWSKSLGLGPRKSLKLNSERLKLMRMGREKAQKAKRESL